MHAFLTVLIGILMLATLGVLLAGMVGMVRRTTRADPTN